MVVRHWTDGVAFHVLLRLALGKYEKAIRKNLRQIDLGNLPKNGIFVLTVITDAGVQLRDVIETLGASKQVAGHLIDTLVERGYVTRCFEASSRRSPTLKLTGQGRAAASVVGLALYRLDQRLTKKIGAEFLFHTRVTLGAIVGKAPGDRRLRYFRPDDFF